MRVRLPLGDVAYELRPGHRLRLAISSSLHGLYLVHPGTGEPIWSAVPGAAEQRLQLERLGIELDRERSGVRRCSHRRHGPGRSALALARPAPLTIPRQVHGLA